MKLKHLLLTLILCTGSYAFADDPLIELLKKNILSPYENFFNQKRERVYLHFNRSEYIGGDNIWFKAYVYESKTKQPMLTTNKLYAELFDQNGKLIERRTLFVLNGAANSHFKLNNKLKSGIYTIRAYTNWMRNFNDQPIYSREFKVQSLGSSIPTGPSLTETGNEPDIQVFPEGGMFVEGIDNHFGVKVTMPNGLGTKVTGSVIGHQNDTLQTFTTNHLGFGDFIIDAAEKVKYRIAIKYDVAKHKEITIPEPVERGIGMMVNSSLSTKVIIALKTNPKTAAVLQGNDLFIMIHNNGMIYRSSSIKVSASGFISSVSKSLLGPGVNYITVFGPGFKPLAERLIFNNTIDIKGQVDIYHSSQNDSLALNLTTSNTALIRNSASLSLSVLPANTVGNNFSNSLHSDVLLSSAIKGGIESADYYFESNDLKHQKDLDNLLLTQGWRGYKWPEILAGKEPEVKYPFENGFTVQATSENLFKGKGEKNSKLSLFSPKNNLILTSEVDEQGHALFNSLYLRDSTHIVLSASNLKGSGSNRNLKASVQYLNLDSTIAIPKTSSGIINPTSTFTKQLTAGRIELDEVVITGKKVVNPFEDDIYSSASDQVHIITKDNYNQYTSMESLLRGRFFLKVSTDQMGELTVDMGRGARSLMGSNSPTLILDGSQMQDLSMLSMISIQDIEAISVNKTGASLGLNGGNGSINIITRKKPLDWGDNSEYKNTRTIFVNGYANNAEFFTPKYILSPASETFQKFASIYWNPEVNTDSTGKAHIKFPIPKELTEFTIRIEGISQTGTVYYDFKKISTKPEL